MNLKNVRKEYLAIAAVAVVVLSVLVILSVYRAEAYRFWLETTVNPDCEEFRSGGSVPGSITVKWNSSIAAQEKRGQFFENVGLNWGSWESGLGSVSVPVGKESQWICILASEGLIEYGQQEQTFRLL
jgi:hypothetical protein